MVDDAYIYRSKDQVRKDLGKALNFSPESLAQNRKGKLSSAQAGTLHAALLRPGALGFFMAVLPFLAWTLVTSSKEQAGLLEAAQIFVQQLFHLSDLAESVGKMGVVMRVGSLVMGLGLAAVILSKFSVAMLFDVLDGKVIAKEGRVVAREEQILRENGRDPIEKYFFAIRGDYHQVTLAAFRAIENGSIYTSYVLPRSNKLVSLEPKLNSDDVKAEPSVPAATPEPVSETQS